MSSRFDKKTKCYVDSEIYNQNNKAPYDDVVISRKNEIVKFPSIFPNKCEDININERIKAYKKELKKESKHNKHLAKMNNSQDKKIAAESKNKNDKVSKDKNSEKQVLNKDSNVDNKNFDKTANKEILQKNDKIIKNVEKTLNIKSSRDINNSKNVKINKNDKQKNNLTNKEENNTSKNNRNELKEKIISDKNNLDNKINCSDKEKNNSEIKPELVNLDEIKKSNLIDENKKQNLNKSESSANIYEDDKIKEKTNNNVNVIDDSTIVKINDDNKDKKNGSIIKSINNKFSEIKNKIKSSFADKKSNEKIDSEIIGNHDEKQSLKKSEINQTKNTNIKSEGLNNKNILNDSETIKNDNLKQAKQNIERTSVQRQINQNQTNIDLNNRQDEQILKIEEDILNHKAENSELKKEIAVLKQQSYILKNEIIGYKQENNAFKSEIAGYKQENNAFKKEIASYKQENNVFKKEIASYKQENNAFKKEIAGYKQENNVFKKEISSYKDELSVSKKEVDYLKKQIDSLKQDFENNSLLKKEEEQKENIVLNNSKNNKNTKEKVVNSSKEKPTSKFLSIAFAFVFVVNVVLLIIVAYNIKYGGTKNLQVNNNSIVVKGDGLTTYAIQTAWQSSVCVAVGGNVTDEITFFTKSTNRGSGVVYKYDEQSDSSYIITCYHVIEKNESLVYVLFSNYLKPIRASVVGYSIPYDIAVLKVENISNIFNQKVAKTYDSQFLSIGETVFAIGNSLSSGLSVSSGIISMLNKKVSVESGISREIQTDATINPGNSGGGLFNQAGELIGIVNAKLSTIDSGDTTVNVEGTSYAIPGTLAINIADSIIRNNGYTTNADIGVSFTHSDRYISNVDVNGKLIQSYEVRVKEVVRGSVSYGKLQTNDIILSFEYEDINGVVHEIQMYNEYCFEDIAFNIKKGSNITFRIIRPLFNENKIVTINASVFDADL